MTLHLTIPLAVAAVGAVVYGLVEGKLGELGKMAFVAGLVVALLRGLG